MLPSNYNSFDTYFHDALKFLEEYSWLFNCAVTDILIHDSLNKIPLEWRDILLKLTNDELNQFPRGLLKESWPDSLKAFCEMCQKIKLKAKKYEPKEKEWDFPSKLRRGLSVKKKHEVHRLAQIIHEECASRGTRKVVDIGSGLGYVGQILHAKYFYSILCLESNPSLVKAAAKRQRNLCCATEDIVHVECKANASTEEDIKKLIIKEIPKNRKSSCQCKIFNEQLVEPRSVSNKSCEIEINKQCMDQGTVSHEVNDSKKMFAGELLCDSSEEQPEKDLPHITSLPSDSACLIGLHACADLSATAARIFVDMPILKHLIILPCCYHRMTIQEASSYIDGTDKKILYFPMSFALQNSIKFSPNPSSIFQKYFLRLAAQETSVRWECASQEDHNNHSLQLMTRAVLYLCAHKESFILKKKHRHGVKKTCTSSFDEILGNMLDRYEFRALENSSIGSVHGGDIIPAEIVKNKMVLLWNEYEDMCHLGEVYTALQLLLQGAVESIVLLDKVAYLQENLSSVSCEIVKLVDEKLSPRCHCIVARK